MKWISPPSLHSLERQTPTSCFLHSLPSPSTCAERQKDGLSAQTSTNVTVSSSLSTNNCVHIGHSAPCHVCPTISTDSMVLGMIVFPFLKREVRMEVVVDDVRSSKRAPRRMGARASHHRVLGIRLCVCLIFSFLILSLLRI